MNLKPQKQIVKHDPKKGLFGDCFRTAVAVAIGRDLNEVPHVAEHGAEGMHDRMRAWLRSEGMDIFLVNFDQNCTFENILALSSQMNPGIPMLASGRSPRHDCNHVVVILDGEVVCDPATGEPSGPECFTGPCDNEGEKFWFVEIIVKLPEMGLAA